MSMLDERAAKRNRDRIKEQQARAERIREQIFGRQKLAKAKKEAAAYEARRKQQVKLRTTRLEDAQARAEELRKKKFGRDKLAKQEAEARDYAERRKRQVRLEDARETAERIKREQFGWEEAEKREAENRAEGREQMAPGEEQPVKQDGNLKGFVVGAVNMDALAAQKAAEIASFEELMADTDHGWEAMLFAVGNEYGPYVTALINSYNLDDQLRTLVHGAIGVIGTSGGVFRVFKRGKFSDQQ